MAAKAPSPSPLPSLAVETATQGSAPVSTYVADPVAAAALAHGALTAEGPPSPECCDACDAPIEGEGGGSGLYVWTRGEERRVEEPPLCAACATAIGLSALGQWTVEEEEG